MELQKGNQIAAGRALLGWDQKDLAERVGITTAGISKIEKGDNRGKASTIAKIQQAFEGAGVEFTTNGVRLKRNVVRLLKGEDGFIKFFDDVYWTLRETRNSDVCISTIDEHKFDLLPRAYFKMHKERILNLKLGVRYKVLCVHGQLYQPAVEYAEYRWAPKGAVETVPHYIYGDKLAMVIFDKEPRVYILEEKEITDMHRRQFSELWSKSLKPIGKVVVVKPEHREML